MSTVASTVASAFNKFVEAMPLPGMAIPKFSQLSDIVNRASQMLGGLGGGMGQEQAKAFACGTLYKGACMATEPGKLDISKLYTAAVNPEAASAPVAAAPAAKGSVKVADVNQMASPSPFSRA